MLNRNFVFLLLISFAVIISQAQTTQTIKIDGNEAVAGEVIVKFKTNGLSKSSGKEGLLKLYNASVKKVWITGAELWSIPTDATVTVIEALKQIDQIDYVCPNYRTKATDVKALIPNDPMFSQQWQLLNTGQGGGKSGADISVTTAWDKTRGDTSIVVGVIDSGVEINHSDLQANIWINKKEIPGNSIDDDGNGYIDDVYGWDFVDNDNNPDPKGNNHGTVSAGLIGAVQNNSIGVSGVAPSVRIMVLRALNEHGDGTAAMALSALEYAIKNGVKITNHSYAAAAAEPATIDMYARANQQGLLAVASAGNAHLNLDDGNGIVVPAMLSFPNIISVGNSTKQDLLAPSSCFGIREVDVVAPGDGVYTTDVNGAYGYGSGTSASAPMAAGVCALIWSAFPQLTAVEVKQQLMLSSDYVPSLAYYSGSTGRVNAFRAVNGLLLSPLQLGTFRLAFGAVQIGQSSPIQEVKIINPSLIAAVVDSVVADEGFLLQQGGSFVRKITSLNIGSHDSVAVQALLRPLASVKYGGTITVYYKNIYNQTVPHRCLVTGQGIGSGTIITQAQVSGRWTKQESPYYINTDVTVQNSLTIEPGTTVVFNENTILACYGPARLTIRGTASDSVHITAADKNLGWGGIVLGDTGPGDVLIEYAVLEYGVYKPMMITLKNFNRKRQEGGALYAMRSSPIIKNCRFSKNGNSGIVGGALFVGQGNPVIENSVFTQNISYDGAIGLMECSSSVLSNILMADNTGQVISMIDFAGGTYILNNLSAYNNSGTYGIVSDYDAKVTINNSILYKNYGANLFLAGSFFSTIPSEIGLNYSLIDTSTYASGQWSSTLTITPPKNINWGTGCFAADPKFISEPSRDFHLSAGSPAIDSGTTDITALNMGPTDLAGNVRIVNGRIDLGVFESGASAIALPPVPALLTPQDKLTAVPVSPKLVWTSSVRAGGYRVQTSTDSLFASAPEIDISVVRDTMKIVGPLQNEKKYFWRVAAGNESGLSSWSVFRSFVTASAPVTPLLQSPADKAVEVPIPAKLSWKKSAGASSFRIQISVNGYFTPPQADLKLDSTLTDTSLTIGPLLGKMLYTWRVAAVGDGGTVWSSAFQFTTTTAPPQAVTLRIPQNASATVTLPTVLRWNESYGATKYFVEVSQDSLFGTVAVRDSSTSAGYAAMSLLTNIKYFWRVSASNNAGRGSWSSTRSFVTIAGSMTGNLPNAVTLDQPASGSTNLSVTPQLYHFQSYDGTFYNLQVSTDSSFKTMFLNDTAVVNYVQVVGPLKGSTRYYWRVRGRNDFGWGPFSAPWWFTTKQTSGLARLGYALPVEFSLSQNYPNPFNPSTTIRFGLPNSEPVTLVIYDVLGRHVQTLVEELLPAGYYEIRWNAKVASGMYLCRIQAGTFIQTRKMILMK